MNVTVIDIDNEMYSISYKRFEYPSLMELIINTFYSEIGACKGRALCGTCIVEVPNEFNKEPLNEQEKHTLKVHNQMKKNSRLACQISLCENIDGAVFKLIEEP